MKIPTKRIIIKMTSIQECNKDHNLDTYHIHGFSPQDIVDAINWMYRSDRVVGGTEILMIGVNNEK